jgi:hypothetical protein
LLSAEWHAPACPLLLSAVLSFLDGNVWHLLADNNLDKDAQAAAYAALVKESMKDWRESLSHSRDSRIIEGSKHAGSLSLLDDARVSYFPNPHADRTGVQPFFEASKGQWVNGTFRLSKKARDRAKARDREGVRLGSYDVGRPA